MSETERTLKFQEEGGGEPKAIKINIDKTVRDLINKYLEGKNLKNQDNDFAFMVGAKPLKSKNYIDSKIKHLRFLKPNTIIKVREVDTKMGGVFQ
jgi:hypothetical protein